MLQCTVCGTDIGFFGFMCDRCKAAQRENPNYKYEVAKALNASGRASPKAAPLGSVAQGATDRETLGSGSRSDDADVRCKACGKTLLQGELACSSCGAREDREMSEVKPQSLATPLRSARHRYRDAYRLARVITGIGSLIKSLAIGQTAVIAFATIVLAIQINSDTAVSVLAVGLVFAGIVGIANYLFGLVVAAQGQILKASVDGAVHSSPFLSLEEKADEMSL